MQRKYLFLNNGPETSADGLKQELWEAWESVISTPPVCTALTRYYNDKHSVGKTQSQISNNIKRKTGQENPWGSVFLFKPMRFLKQGFPLGARERWGSSKNHLKASRESTRSCAADSRRPQDSLGVSACVCTGDWTFSVQECPAMNKPYKSTLQKGFIYPPYPSDSLWGLSGRVKQVAMDGCMVV